MKRYLLICCIACIHISTFAQSGGSPHGDGCVGKMTFNIDEGLPENLVYKDIKELYADRYAGGEVGFIAETIDALVTGRCRHRRHVIEVKLDLKLKTDIVAKGHPHPTTGDPRTQDGIDQTKKHEAIHRARFIAAFNDFHSRLLPPTKLNCQAYPAMTIILYPIRDAIIGKDLWTPGEWAKIKTLEFKHETDEWFEWYEKNEQIW